MNFLENGLISYIIFLIVSAVILISIVIKMYRDKMKYYEEMQKLNDKQKERFRERYEV